MEIVVNAREELLPRRIHYVKARHSENTESKRIKYTPINKPPKRKDSTKVDQSRDDKKSVMNGKSSSDPVGDEYLYSIMGKPNVFLFDQNQLQVQWNEATPIGCGLNNLGNTCFLNSTLQCLTYTPCLTNLLQSRFHSKSCTNKGFCLFCIMESHVNATTKRSKNQSFTPKAFVANLRAISKHFRRGRQEDSHEFLRFVIDHMQRNSLRAKGAAKLSKIDKETSVIHSIFGGVLQSQVKCQKCFYESDTFDPCLDLSLDIKGCNSLERALQRFCRTEVLDTDNQYRCDHCKKLSNAHKQFTIFKAPTVAVFHLKRFNHYGQKVNKFISFPEQITLNPYMSRRSDKHTEQFHYQLHGVLVHMGGSVNSGHYYCYVKSPSGSWYEMNDESVQQVSLKTVLKEQAYILFYSRVSIPQKSNITPSGNNVLKKRRRESEPADVLSKYEPPKKKVKVENNSSPVSKKSWKQIEPQQAKVSPQNSKSPSSPNQHQKKQTNAAAIVKKWDEKVKRVFPNNNNIDNTLSTSTSTSKSKESIDKLFKNTSTFLTSDSLYDKKVGSWDDNNTDVVVRKKVVQQITKEIRRSKPQKRDAYDREYDEGKLKKVRTTKVSLFDKPKEEKVNQFQSLNRIPRVRSIYHFIFYIFLIFLIIE